jgi:hypothetical protein
MAKTNDAAYLQWQSTLIEETGTVYTECVHINPVTGERRVVESYSSGWEKFLADAQDVLAVQKQIIDWRKALAARSNIVEMQRRCH